MDFRTVILISSLFLGVLSISEGPGPSDADIEALRNAIDGGRTPAVAFDGRSFVRPAIPATCQDGPYKLLKQDSGIYYWEPKSNAWLITSTCNGLRCKELECVAASVSVQTMYVFAVRMYPHFQILGFRTIKYEDHLECRCKQCQDFKFNECNCKDSCPNHVSEVKVRDTYCQWNESLPRYVVAPRSTLELIPVFPYAKGQCFCCEVPLSCPRGKVFSRINCECKCPFVLSCSPNHYWSEVDCRCKCKSVYKCSFLQRWNEATCQCECKYPQKCRPGYYWHEATCRCKPYLITIGPPGTKYPITIKPWPPTGPITVRPWPPTGPIA